MRKRTFFVVLGVFVLAQGVSIGVGASRADDDDEEDVEDRVEGYNESLRDLMDTSCDPDEEIVDLDDEEQVVRRGRAIRLVLRAAPGRWVRRLRLVNEGPGTLLAEWEPSAPLSRPWAGVPLPDTTFEAGESHTLFVQSAGGVLSVSVAPESVEDEADLVLEDGSETG